MKKIIALACVICIFITAALVLVLWKPSSLGKFQKITVGLNGEVVELEKGDENFDEVEKAVKQHIRSAIFTIVYKDQPKLQSSDKNVALDKTTFGMWMEIEQKGKYQRLFFILIDTDEKVFPLVYATKTDSFDDGKMLSYANCKNAELIEVLKKL